ncbi:MAG: tetratricopeptide repeat protein [Jejuia sp.]
MLVKANRLRFKNQDSAIYYLEKGHEKSLKEKDTLKAIQFLTGASFLYSHTLNYGKAYDGYWKALLLANESEDSISTAQIYVGLGWLYSFYKRKQEAQKYLFKSLNLRKKLVENKELNIGYLFENYYAIASFYRLNKDYKKARIYLDSLYLINNKIGEADRTENFHANAELGYLAVKNGQFEKGITHLKKAINYFEKNDPSYLVIAYALLADSYKGYGYLQESEDYFLKSLEISKKYKSHLDFRLFVYEELHDLYLKNEKFQKAIEFQNKAKELSDKLYSIQNNQHLFEIKDKYRIEKKRQEDLARQQRIKELEQEDRIWMLQTIILVVSIIFIIVFSFLTIRNIRNRHKNEKLIIKERQKERLKRHRAVLELKNKELTESALRLIEKDEFIASIKSRLEKQKDNLDVNIIKRILKSIQGTPQSNWSEFEARFTTINQSFYEQLKTKFPHLKQTDLKICALVKLNFPSKDMAKLLGISVESVHTSRHRLRKKLGLNRNDNLEEFINSF